MTTPASGLALACKGTDTLLIHETEIPERLEWNMTRSSSVRAAQV